MSAQGSVVALEQSPEPSLFGVRSARATATARDGTQRPCSSQPPMPTWFARPIPRPGCTRPRLGASAGAERPGSRCLSSASSRPASSTRRGHDPRLTARRATRSTSCLLRAGATPPGSPRPSARRCRRGSPIPSARRRSHSRSTDEPGQGWSRAASASSSARTRRPGRVQLRLGLRPSAPLRPSEPPTTVRNTKQPGLCGTQHGPSSLWDVVPRPGTSGRPGSLGQLPVALLGLGQHLVDVGR